MLHFTLHFFMLQFLTLSYVLLSYIALCLFSIHCIGLCHGMFFRITFCYVTLLHSSYNALFSSTMFLWLCYVVLCNWVLVRCISASCTLVHFYDVMGHIVWYHVTFCDHIFFIFSCVAFCYIMFCCVNVVLFSLVC